MSFSNYYLPLLLSPPLLSFLRLQPVFLSSLSVFCYSFSPSGPSPTTRVNPPPLPLPLLSHRCDSGTGRDQDRLPDGGPRQDEVGGGGKQGQRGKSPSLTKTHKVLSKILLPSPRGSGSKFCRGPVGEESSSLPFPCLIYLP